MAQVDMSDNHGGTCVYCGSETQHLNNHIRMSAGEHGPQGSYPDDWNRDDRVRQAPSGTSASGGEEPGAAGPETGEVEPPETGGRTVEPVRQTSQDSDSMTEELRAEAEPIRLGDTAADTREYECGDCGDDVEYLSDCDCGNALVWQGVTA